MDIRQVQQLEEMPLYPGHFHQFPIQLKEIDLKKVLWESYMALYSIL